MNLEEGPKILAAEESKRADREDAIKKKLAIREDSKARVRKPSNYILSIIEIMQILWEVIGRTFHSVYLIS